jgi:excisionase family DNA binding protein
VRGAGKAPDGERLYKLSAVADRVGCSYRTLQRHVEKGALPVVRIGPTKRVRVTETALRRYLGNDDKS